MWIPLQGSGIQAAVTCLLCEQLRHPIDFPHRVSGEKDGIFWKLYDALDRDCYGIIAYCEQSPKTSYFRCKLSSNTSTQASTIVSPTYGCIYPVKLSVLTL